MSINIKTDKGLVKIAPTSYNELTDLPNIKSNGNTTYITDKSGNNVATIGSGGISTTGIVVDNIVLAGKNIRETIAEGSFSGDFHDLTNNPIANTNDGSVSFADVSGNKIAAINAEGVESVEFKAGNHKLTEKADQAYVLYAITELESAAFSGDYNDLENAPIDNVNDGTLIFTDESGNKIGQVDRDGFTSTEFAVGPHRLTNKAERNAPLSNFTEDDEHQLVSSAEKVYWSNKSEFSGKFGDLTENPIIDNKSGNLEYQDVNGNTIVRIDATGLSTTAVSISEGDVATLIAEKADRASLNASNNRISTLESTVSTQGSDINKLRLDINEIDGELSTYKTEVASTYAKQTDLLGVTNRVSTAEEEIDTLQSTVAVHASKVDNIEASDWEFIIVDENSNKGLTLASDGVLYVKEVGVLGGLVDERLAHLENYFSTGEDVDNNLNKWHEIVDFLNGFEETDQALESIIATKADKSTVTALETAYKTADINLGTRIDGVIANYKKADLDITTAYKDADKAITTAYTNADATTLNSAITHTNNEIDNVKDEYKKADDELQIQINARAFQTDLDDTNKLVAYVKDNYVAKSALANEVVTESLVTDAITLNESEFIFADSSGNKIAEINDGGIESTLFIAGVHKLTEKADITYVNSADDTTLNSAKAYTDSKFSSAVTGVKMNGSTNKPSNGIVDLGTVITDVSGKQDKLVSGKSIKTINGVSILGLGNIEIKTETGGITLETDPIFTASAAYRIKPSDINNWNNKTSNVGTVTKVSTGKGLTGGDITTEGVIRCNLNSDDSLGTINTSDKLYAVGVDANNKLCVKVPWANDNTTYTFANGTNGFTVTPKGGLAQTVTVTPSITNNVTYSNTLTNGRIAVFDGTFGKIKDSGFTIETSVPSGAKFTDTTSFNISAGATDDDVIVLTGTPGTNGVSYDAKHAKKFSTSNSTYTSGNSTTSISGSGGKGTIKIPQITVDSYGHVTAAADESVTITMPSVPTTLKNPNALTIGSQTYDGSSKVTITAADLGLSSALKYHGTTTTALTDGATTKPIVIGGSNHNQEQGCVVAYNNSSFVWTGSAWEELGNPGNYKVVQSAVSSPSASGNATAFIDTISLDANGTITVTKKNVQTASTSVYGITKLSSATDSTSEALAATPKAVKSAYDLANSKWTYNANTIKAIKVNTASTADVANSVNWTNVNNRPTNLSQFNDDVVAGKYLPLSGGVMTGSVRINWGSTSGSGIYGNDKNLFLIGDQLQRRSLSGTFYDIIDSGNIGSQVVEGINTHTSSAINAGGDIAKLNSYYGAGIFKISRFNGLDGLGTANSDGLIVNWPLDHAYGQQWYIDDESHTIQTRYVASGVNWSAWKTIAFTDSNITGNAASAYKIIDSSGNNKVYIHSLGYVVVNGFHFSSDVIERKTNDSLYLQYNSTGNTIINANGGNVGIGTTNPSAKLEVNGNVAFGGVATFYDIISINRNGSSGAILNTSKSALKIECYSTYTSFGTYTGGGASTPNVFVLRDNGNIGIGTTSPSQKLHVDGNVKVENGNFIGNLTGTADNSNAVNGTKIAIVSLMPASPDSSTLYFVK